MTRFVQCVKMPMFILSQGVFKYLPVLAEFSGVEWGCQRLCDKSNDKLYAPPQLLPYQQYKKERQETHEEWMTNIGNCCVVQENVS